jgi:5-methylcytosine-specific restriction endonuclease McrA
MKWRALNAEKNRIQKAAYRAANLEKERARKVIYRSEHLEKIHAYEAAYRAANREKKRAYDLAWCTANPEKKRAYRAAYNAAHPTELATQWAKRHAVQCSVTIGDPVAIKAIYRRAREVKNVKCYLCGELIPMGDRHVDHIVPLAKGGAHTASNLAVACAKCNESKGSKHPNEIGMLL